jgi:hypothetical protein
MGAVTGMSQKGGIIGIEILIFSFFGLPLEVEH